MKFKKNSKGVCSEGFRASGVREGRYGIALIVSEQPCVAAGVFTSISVKAAPVVLSQKRLRGKIQAIVANSGCANACVPTGLRDAKAMSRYASKAVGVPEDHIATASTGIIGKRLHLEVLRTLIRKASTALSTSSRSSLDAAKAIMTTDTKPKTYSISYRGIEVGGIVKGSGMIHPGMATMLCFITTNANLQKKTLQSCLRKSTDESFNQLSIDSDPSTNDTVLLLASGRKHCDKKIFQEMLNEVTSNLARQIAADGEGAKKTIEVLVKGARTQLDARIASRAVVSSPLVKTAIYGSNPNWGRIAAKIGSVIKVQFEKMTITLSSKKGTSTILSNGRPIQSKKASAILKRKEIKITVELSMGGNEAKAWGCDLTPEYVKINAEYN